MRFQKLDRLTALQIAVLAAISSTVAALGTVLALRQLLHHAPEPAVPKSDATATRAGPAHFSEDGVIPVLREAESVAAAADERNHRNSETV